MWLIRFSVAQRKEHRAVWSQFMLTRRVATIILCGWALSGCSQLWINTWQTISPAFISPESQINQAQLDPSQVYLRVQSNGQVTLWSQVTESKNGTRQVFVSKDSGLMRLERGRLLSTFGFKYNWREVDEPKWSTGIVEIGGGARQFDRVLSMGPPLQVKVRYHVTQTTLTDLPLGFEGWQQAHLLWVQESAVRADQPKEILIGIYGLQKDTRSGEWQVLAASQCLQVDYCIQWQHTPIKAVDHTTGVNQANTYKASAQ